MTSKTICNTMQYSIYFKFEIFIFVKGSLRMNTDIEFVQKFNLAYNAMCKPLCQQLKLPQTAFDILMFFGNNPEYHTASDVVEIRRIKANLVSVNPGFSET